MVLAFGLWTVFRSLPASEMASPRVLFARAYYLLKRDRVDEAQVLLDQANFRGDPQTRVLMLYDMANTRLQCLDEFICGLGRDEHSSRCFRQAAREPTARRPVSEAQHVANDVHCHVGAARSELMREGALRRIRSSATISPHRQRLPLSVGRRLRTWLMTASQ